MSDIGPLIGLLSLALTIFLAIGGVLAFIGLAKRSNSEVQASTITALQAQNDAQEKQMALQEKQIALLEKKIMHFERVIGTIQLALKRRGLRIEINGETITLIDESKRSASTVQIRIDSDELPEVDGKETN